MGRHINLLPWRSERRARRLRDFKRSMLVAAALGTAVAALWYLHGSSALRAQQARNGALHSEINRLDRQLAELAELEAAQQELLARIRFIESLQRSRAASVHFFEQVADTLPDGAYLTALRRRDQRVTIEGVAESSARVSRYLRNLDASPWFTDPRLVVIRTTERDGLRQAEFTMTVRGLRNAGGGAGDGAES